MNLFQDSVYFFIIVNCGSHMQIFCSVFPLTKHCPCHATGFVPFSRIRIYLRIFKKLVKSKQFTLKQIINRLEAPPFLHRFSHDEHRVVFSGDYLFAHFRSSGLVLTFLILQEYLNLSQTFSTHMQKICSV